MTVRNTCNLFCVYFIRFSTLKSNIKDVFDYCSVRKDRLTVIICWNNDGFVIFAITMCCRVQNNVPGQEFPDCTFVVKQDRLRQINW